MRIFFAILAVSIILASGCIAIGDQQAGQPECVSPEKAINGSCCFDSDDNGVCDINEKACPVSCDDSNACTTDHCSVQTSFECRHDTVKPCCGNGECETSEDAANECPQDCTVIKMTGFIHSYTGPDYMENDTYVFIHTGSNETDKKPDFYLNITADKVKLHNIRSTYNCTDSATGHKIDSITVDRVPVVEDFPTEFGYENKFNSADYTIYTTFYSKEMKSTIDVAELGIGKTVEFRIRFLNKNYKVRSKLTCDFDFYFLEPLKHVKKHLKISYI
jgi:hypothetical protein